MDLNTPIQQVRFIGPIFAKRLEKLGIRTVEDLLNHYPHRYDNFSLISKIKDIRAGETSTIQATVTEMKNEYTKSGRPIQKATVSDGSGSLQAIWFNQPFLVRTIKIGEKYNFAGEAKWFGRQIALVGPEYEALRETTLHTGRLVPVYPETYGVSSKWLRSRIAPLLKEYRQALVEYLPPSLLTENQLIDYREAIEQIHFPENKISEAKARRRLEFDELFLIQLASLIRKLAWKKEQVGHKFQIQNLKFKIQKFIESLPFTLTTAQRRTVSEILTDLGKDQPMNRLLEGDVGSGKTVVAAIAIYVAFLNGFKTAFMAPTEILALQHFETLQSLLKPFGARVLLRTASQKEAGEFDVLVGTHALISEKLTIPKLGLVVIDEQHRFGVEQRTKLKEKGSNPHLLTMTATPIPRTVALTLYGELDLSFLDEMPQGRLKIKTWVVPPEKRQAAYGWIRKHVQGTLEQAFIICPLIEESETLTSVKAAAKEFKYLKENVFPDMRLGLIHGKLKTKEKDAVLGKFRQGTLDIMVATPVVEVGIDVPNATIMMIEAADHFGLAQLHQLRGRVGRSNLESYCLLFADHDTKRLKALEKIYIGAKLAELDLKLRGPGEIYGTRQHGLPDLRIASLTNLALIEKTRRATQEVVEKLDELPLLREKVKRFTIEKVLAD